MHAFFLTAAMLATASETPLLDGSKLQPGESCYAITLNGEEKGATWQTIRATHVDEKPAWDIVIHQQLPEKGFDLRDHFLLDGMTLRPIAFDSQRGKNPESRGWQKISLHYAPDRILGTRESSTGIAKIDVALDAPVWEGNLWGVAFAALPLHSGGRYTLPFWQYDKGFGALQVNVVEEKPAKPSEGQAGIWVLDAGDDPDSMIRYTIADHPRAELGYSIGPMAQKLGGDCSAIKDMKLAP